MRRGGGEEANGGEDEDPDEEGGKDDLFPDEVVEPAVSESCNGKGLTS